MKFYLSSYEIGNDADKLKNLTPHKKIGYIPNARDFTGADPERTARRSKKDMNSLRGLGLEVEMLDLRNYFVKNESLKNKLDDLGAIFISGGNTFVLRQAMSLSGLDDFLKKNKDNNNFLYAGYSAAGCVLAPSLKGMDLVDPLDTPYGEQKEILWEGLGLVDFRFMPHFQSDHPESASVEKEIEYCKQNNIIYRTVRDGEVIIIS